MTANEYDTVPFDQKDCVLDTARFFDSTTGQWGYSVMCCTSYHKGPEPCPEEREIFRRKPEQWWLDRQQGSKC